MKAVIITSSEKHLKKEYLYMRGEKVTVIEYIMVMGELMAVCLTSKGLFKPVPVIHLGEGHELSRY